MNITASALAPSSTIQDDYQPHVHLPHPYYPVEAEIVGYLANTYTLPFLLLSFAGMCAALFLVTGVVAKKINPGLSSADCLTVMWFVLTGSIHLFFEGYYAYNYRTLGGTQSLFGQMWKEYALSDSRYLTQDAFVLCIETITAATWGPLSFVTAHLVTLSHPLRHPMQIIVSLGQLYGNVLYYATGMFALYMYDIRYSRPEAYYFWGYFLAINFLWILIPGGLIYNSVATITGAFITLRRVENGLSGSAAEGGNSDANGQMMGEYEYESRSTNKLKRRTVIGKAEKGR